MAVVKHVRWNKLDKTGRAQQFMSRGTERTARAQLRSNCDFCEKPISEGDKYFDINAAKYAHSLCVSGQSAGPSKHGKVITHKMIDVLAAKKVVPLKAKGTPGRKPKTAAKNTSTQSHASALSKRGRKPKVESIKTQAESIKLSEVKEALPGAIVTLTITGTVEAVQRALDKLQN